MHRKWEWLDGQFLREGKDLLQIIQSLPAHRIFNFIDSILVEDIVTVSVNEEAVKKLRAQWNKLYDRIEYNSGSNDDAGTLSYDGTRERPEGYIPGNYVMPGENGFGPLGAPMGE